MAAADLIPVNIITGFLGSGKTSLLQRLLASPALADTAVLVNEFGEVGLDHHLLRRVDTDIVLLQSGCLCCTIRGDLGEAIRDLYSHRERGQIPPFARLVIETTGLADPVPILSTIMAEPVIRHHFRLGNTITTVDAMNGPLHLDRQPESVKQAAVADRLVVTKIDLATPAAVAALRERLRRLNPSARHIETDGRGPLDPSDLLTPNIDDEQAKSDEVRRWLATETAAPGAAPHHHHDVNRHDSRIHAFCLRYASPLDWTAFGLWLSMLLHRHGEDVLRVKGLLNVAGSDRPVVVHGVQHLIHPPFHLADWPDDDHSSRIVFIVRSLDRTVIERSLAAFNGIANPPDEPRPSRQPTRISEERSHA
jgi:G3E family GTPase